MNAADTVINAMQVAWLWLATELHPLAPWIAMVGLVFALVYSIRKWVPGVWQWAANKGPIGVAASKCFQAAPSVLLGALIVSISTGADVKLTVIGAVTALAAPLGHEIMKWASARTPGPTYLGGSWPAAGKAEPPPGSIRPSGPEGKATSVLLVLVVLLLTGCTGSLQQQRLEGQRMRAIGTLSAASADRCESLDNQYRWAGAIGKVAAAGAVSAASIAASGQIEDERVERGLIIGAAVSGAIGAGALLLSESSSESHARECSQ